MAPPIPFIESVMAEKLSKSILRNLEKILHRAPKKPSGSTPMKPSASKEGEREHAPSPSSAGQAPDQAGTPETPEAKPDKKKTKNQPWYRHRQRW
jgi:hypothetical protein